MKGLFLLIPVSLVFFAVAVVVFMWAVKSGQYDDLDGEGERILFDDDEADHVVDGDDQEQATSLKKRTESPEQDDANG